MSYADYSPLEFVKELSFIRYGGTPSEKQAAELIQAKVTACGGTAALEPFQIAASTYTNHLVKVVAPFEKVIDTTPYGMCGSIPAPGMDLEFLYAEQGTEKDFISHEDLSHCVVMVNMLNLEVYKRLAKRKAAAILVVMGKHYHNNSEASVYARNLRPQMRELGVIPAFCISAAAAAELVCGEAKLVHIELEQTDGESTSHNVIATLEGTAKPQESIVITGHYDSLPIGPGAWDNATGSAMLMGLYHYFYEHPPKRTLRFIWCGSEEQGLLGSKAYINQHEDFMEQIKFCFIFDMCGTTLGYNKVYVTGNKQLEDFVELFCREVGYSAEVFAGVHSSDSAPFADRGVPGLGLTRACTAAEIHTSRDTVIPLSEKALLDNLHFAAALIERAANSVMLPVDCGMPDDMKEKLDKYFQRNTDKDKKE